MQNLWNNEDALHHLNDPLSTRVYATSLIAKTEALANGLSSIGSAKTDIQNPFGETEAHLAIIENDRLGEAPQASDLALVAGVLVQRNRNRKIQSTRAR